MKKNLLFATAILALVACTSEEFVGDQSIQEALEKQRTIEFSSGLSATTRAELRGGEAAAKLGNEFVVSAFKGSSSVATMTVFDNYRVVYTANSANTTLSNTNNWEYVGIGDQTIKYWDFGQDQYDFIAYSLGDGGAEVTASIPSPSPSENITDDVKSPDDGAYTIKGTIDQLKTVHISDLKTVLKADYGKPVELSFRSLMAKVRLALYETVPGYSVKDVKFYTSGQTGASSSTDAALYVSEGSGIFDGIDEEEKPTVCWATMYFPTLNDDTPTSDKNKVHVQRFSLSYLEKFKTFGSLNYTTAERPEFAGTGSNYLGRQSNQATFAGESANSYYQYIIPYEDNDLYPLTLKVDYTLVSNDRAAETIEVKGVEAVVPFIYAQWKPGYAYTYIFKISDDKLTPITFDAVEVEDDGNQETITTVSEPSITTYAKGESVTNNDEYTTGVPVYIIVNDGTSNVELTGKANLYTVTLAASTDVGDVPAASAAQSISEESVAKALVNGTKDDPTNPTTWTVKDANLWKMVVTKSDLMSLVSAIDATDSPTGNEISIGASKVGKFTPAAEGTYVFEYVQDAVSATYKQATGTYVSGTTYYTDDTGATEVDTSSLTEGSTDVSSYYVVDTPAKPAVKTYKVIKVVAAP